MLFFRFKQTNLGIMPLLLEIPLAGLGRYLVPQGDPFMNHTLQGRSRTLILRGSGGGQRQKDKTSNDWNFPAKNFQ